MKKAFFTLVMLVAVSAVAQSKHTVQLTWTPTPSTTTNIYRSNVTGTACASPANKIASGLTSNTFTDVNVTNGAVYFYAASAQNSGGESACTSEVQAQIPVPPSPPTNFSATVQ